MWQTPPFPRMPVANEGLAWDPSSPRNYNVILVVIGILARGYNSNHNNS